MSTGTGQQRDRRRQSPAEELANSVTHGVGALLAAAGPGVLVVLAARRV
ncbi:MAG: hypothetical protein R6W82_02250 [bacterium]